MSKSIKSAVITAALLSSLAARARGSAGTGSISTSMRQPDQPAREFGPMTGPSNPARQRTTVQRVLQI